MIALRTQTPDRPPERRADDPPRRVLMIAPHPCFESRGSPINVGLMCRALTEHGYAVDLVTYPFGEHVDMPGLTYHRVRRPPFMRSVGIGFSYEKLPLDVLLCAKTLELLCRRRYVAVHAVEEAAFFAIPLAWVFRTPAITDVDSDMHEQLAAHPKWMARLFAPLARPALWATLRLSTCALTVCAALTERAQRLSPRTPVFQIEDIPLPLHAGDDVADAARLRSELGLNGERVVVYTGNLESYQGLELLIDALPRVAARHPKLALVVVGGDEARVRQLRRYADERGINGLLRLTGKRPQSEMSAFMRLADVLVSPRCQGQNTPLKIYTYMLSGRPIVATDLPTHTQVLDDSTAILTPATPAGMARGLVAALENRADAEQRAERARRRAEQEFNFAVFSRKVIDVYRHVGGAAVTRVSAPLEPDCTRELVAAERPAS
jgi:glycosyltransferase involved in cell wall biosynthesis